MVFPFMLYTISHQVIVMVENTSVDLRFTPPATITSDPLKRPQTCPYLAWVISGIASQVMMGNEEGPRNKMRPELWVWVERALKSTCHNANHIAVNTCMTTR